MRTQPTDFPSQHRLIGVAATIAVHIGLLCCWLLAREVGVDDEGPQADAIQWVDVRPDKPVAAPPPVARAEPAAPKKPAHPRLTPVAPPEPETVAQDEARSEPAPQAPPAKSAYDMLQQARRDIGKIDQEIKKEFPEQHIKRPVDTPQARLEKGIELAAEMAPPKWYQPAKIKELTDPGQFGRKRYRVITAYGTYCMTYESANSPNGQDHFTRGNKPKVTNCDADEEPVKPQKW